MTLPLQEKDFKKGIAPRGRISLEFAADGDGRSYLRRQFAAYPFHVCKVQYPDAAEPGLATLYAQSCSGGIYEHDDLSIELTARRGANVHFTTQASTIVHGMAHGTARQSIQIVAEENTYLEFLPDPQILFPQSWLMSAVRVAVAETATVVMCDAFLLPDPSCGSGVPHHYCSSLAVEDSHGRQLAADRLTLTSRSFAEGRPGVLGRYRAQATLLVITQNPAITAIQARIRDLGTVSEQTAVGVTQLPNTAGYMCRVLAPDGVSLKRAINTIWRIVRQELKGHEPEVRRK